MFDGPYVFCGSSAAVCSLVSSELLNLRCESNYNCNSGAKICPFRAPSSGEWEEEAVN